MIAFVFRYWIELLLTTGSSTTIYIIKQYISLKNGLKSLLRNEIIRIYEKYVQLGYCPSYMKENTSEMYNSYHKLGGNGMITSMMEDLYKLPNELQEGRNEKNFEW